MWTYFEWKLWPPEPEVDSLSERAEWEDMGNGH